MCSKASDKIKYTRPKKKQKNNQTKKGTKFMCTNSMQV